VKLRAVWWLIGAARSRFEFSLQQFSRLWRMRVETFVFLKLSVFINIDFV
jgi:hypothetical protein